MGSSIHTQRDAPAHGAVTVTPADSNLSYDIRGFYVGATGDVRVTTINGNDVTFVAVPAGQIMPISCQRIWSTGTTATSIVGLY